MAGSVDIVLKCLVLGAVMDVGFSLTINIDNEDLLKVLHSISTNSKKPQQRSNVKSKKSPMLKINTFDGVDNNIPPDNEEPTNPIKNKKLSGEKIAEHVKVNFESLYRDIGNEKQKGSRKIASNSFDNYDKPMFIEPTNIPDNTENFDFQNKNNVNEKPIDYEDLKKDPIEYNYVTRKWDRLLSYRENLTAEDLEAGDPNPSILRHFAMHNYETIINATVEGMSTNMENIFKKNKYNVDDKVKSVIKSNLRQILKSKLDENNKFMNDNVPNFVKENIPKSVKDTFEDEVQKRKEKLDELSLDFHDH